MVWGNKIGAYTTCPYIFTTRLANVWSICYRKERHGDAATSKACMYVAVLITLHDRLVREGSQRRSDFSKTF